MATIHGLTSGVAPRSSATLHPKAGGAGNGACSALKTNAGIDHQVVQMAVGPSLIEVAADVVLAEPVGFENHAHRIGTRAQAAAYPFDPLRPGRVDEHVEDRRMFVKNALSTSAHNYALSQRDGLVDDSTGQAGG